MSYLTELEKLVNEALSNELMYLKRYLTMSDEDKTMNRAFDNPWWIDEYLSSIDYEEPDDFSDMEDYEKVEWLGDNDKTTMLEYGDYVADKSEYYSGSEQELYDLVDYTGFTRNKWLMHFSDNAYGIWSDQTFKHGTPYEDYERLALSTHFTDASKKSGGYNFAYEIGDVDKYAFTGRGSSPKYGSEAVLFRGDGLRIYHNADEEFQVIFDGKSTKKPIIYIQYDDGNWKIDSTQTGEKLVSLEKIEDVAAWVEQNYAQYRKHLEP